MERAVVLIGVHKSGDLPRLEAVDRGIDHMHDWAKSQGIPDTSVRILSDTEGGIVRSSAIYEAVESFVNRRTLEQLIVYFCGHGVNKNYGEYWLLSDAPDNPNEAVNLAVSMALAERCKVPHVVLISDACRTAPASIRCDSVYGSSIFPNRPTGGAAASTDVFYACRLGDPSFEVPDPDVSSEAYRALYTEVIAKALKGGYPKLLEAAGDGREEYVRPFPLKHALPELLSQHIGGLGAALTVNQRPDGTVTSDQQVAWLSRFLRGATSSSLGLEAASDDSGGAGASDDSGASDSSDTPEETPPPADPVSAAAAAAAVRLAHSFDPGVIDAPAAVHVRGATFESVYPGRVEASQLTDQLVQVRLTNRQPDSSVLLHLGSGHCAVVPALLGRVATMTVEDDQLVDVSYAPLTQGNMRRKQLDPIYIEMRARIAAASRFGISWWEGASPENLVEIFEKCGESDPSLAVYFAHALASLSRRDLVSRLQLRNSRMLFDVMLMGDGFDGPVVPFLPLLSRGWALLGLLTPDVRLSAPIPHNSHWTLFADTEIPRLRELLDLREAM
ncbi:caspase family protein [Streptomyces gardneri]|uniref:Peptidase C14 caspase domain-containing protein n=1 Tax=Streptomyces gardneri TaxID=66892 RepID=A0A4Y3RR66_9ACTN|nr:caspase family protein [Streptomyces gardneri]GEB60072.1 hypothetical protein SGA01_56770 [Streptomyces gardneri]GHH21127.1 hypothetical protein GCM10017674_75560 [Streptomyces gardneri]